ncbi:hypothetical protein EWB00_000533 [Schistosoma japonicum]|uniref:Uncharacterized protein n=1 Tax=Schistosoma japonicum TaxID=6182 RepID=A0A4Z2CKE8_SCHJA|nr:hypothetical protein EWB00_000533 [Schistosoma japonicum]
MKSRNAHLNRSFGNLGKSFSLWSARKSKEKSCVGGMEAMHLARNLEKSGEKVLNAVNKTGPTARCADLLFGEYLGCGALTGELDLKIAPNLLKSCKQYKEFQTVPVYANANSYTFA